MLKSFAPDAVEETGVRTVGPPGAGGRGEDRPACDPDEQSESEPRAPAGPQLGPEPEPDGSHYSLLKTAAAGVRAAK